MHCAIGRNVAMCGVKRHVYRQKSLKITVLAAFAACYLGVVYAS
jgi:hypothetical protein